MSNHFSYNAIKTVISNLSDLIYAKRSQPDGYLYVPFTEEELSPDTLENISKFQRNLSKTEKKKNFTILHHNQCELSTLPPNAKIYVLGHGIDCHPDRKKSSVMNDQNFPYELMKHLPFPDWSFSISGGGKAITIDQVAERMIADGLLHTSDVHIKLWFCDPNNKAYALAKRFAGHLSSASNVYRIDFYQNRMLSSPTFRNQEMHKWAIDTDKKLMVRASTVRQSLFSNSASNEFEIDEKDCVKQTRSVV